ncbi:MAG TPA: M1 family aminopeptidase, partial [Chitinophagaceae bacterium]|nr:M1 family aminopeptidase [Chitinophagaceae bacterium]
MKKMILLLTFLLTGMFSFAQENGTCQQTKITQHHQVTKKYRAGISDNALMNQYDVHFYFLDLAIERNSTIVSGSVTMGVNATAIMDTFCFELNNTLTIDSVMYNGLSLQVVRVGNISYAKFPSSINNGQSVSVQIFYHGDASVTGGSAIGDGFATDTSPSWGNQVTWSLSQPYSAYEWFPCKQFLQDKADSSWVYVTTSNQNKVGSNGLLEGVDSLPNNKVRYRWKSHYMMDYYLISVAVAKYVDYTIYAHPTSLPNDSIKIVNYVYDNPNTLTAFKSKIDSNALVLEYFSDLFGLYPFYEEKYGHAMAPIGGGMEHQTMSTMGNLGSFGVNSHELMHQWFGDHVTCKTWKDIFINEGFASYGEYLAYEHFRGLNAAKAL